MSDRIGPVGVGGDGAGNDEELAKLIRRAAPARPSIPAETVDRVHAAVVAAWESRAQQQRPARSKQQRVWALAAAASVVLTLILARELIWRDAGTTVQTLARVVQALGGTNVRAGDTVPFEQWLTTEADGLLAFSLGEHSIRLAPDSRGRFLSARTVELARGAIYVDSGVGGEAPHAVTVMTVFGPVSELGTRFMVSVDEQSLRVRVRDGRVAVGEGDDRYEADAGVELIVDPAGRASRRRIPVFGPNWGWVLRAAAAPPIDGRPLTELLGWAAREQGRIVEFRDAEAKRRVLETVLHGDVDGLSPDEALVATLPTCGLTHVVESGRLVLEVSARNETQ